MKSKITNEEAYTGKELCNLLKIDYESIINQRATDSRCNFTEFIRELLKITQVKDEIQKQLEAALKNV